MNETSSKTNKMFRVTQSTADNKFLVENKTTGEFIRDRKGNIRRFTSRSGARKAITRQTRGDFHR